MFISLPNRTKLSLSHLAKVINYRDLYEQIEHFQHFQIFIFPTLLVGFISPTLAGLNLLALDTYNVMTFC